MRNLLLMLTGCLLALSAHTAFGQSGETSEYVFITEHHTITQTGGIAGVHRTYSIKGRFQLKIDPEAGTASFLCVDANAVDDSDDRYALDPNEVFNLTGLTGTVVDATSIRFEGKTGDGSSVLIALTFVDDTAILNGGTTPPPNSADFFIFALDAVAQRKYADGAGTADDPYRIATAADLISLGETSEDYDKHFILTADIDLDPNLPGRKVFDRAVIAPAMNPPAEVWAEKTGSAYIPGDHFEGIAFTGVFDGDGHRVSHLVIQGGTYAFVGLFGCIDLGGSVRNVYLDDVQVAGSACVGGLVGSNRGAIDSCHVSGRVSGSNGIGGLVGANLGKGYSLLRGPFGAENEAAVTSCSARCEVVGSDSSAALGGLVGNNGLLRCCEQPVMDGAVRSCYAVGNVSGGAEAMALGGLVGWHGLGVIADCYAGGNISAGRQSQMVGGLVGYHSGGVARCYSVGSVSGGEKSRGLGGLMGESDAASVSSFWDVDVSGLAGSDGGTGKTTVEMQMAATYLQAGWDFVGETANGTEDIWWILEGRDYPRLWWELPADDFADGEAGPLWFVYEMTPEWAWLEEVNGRLEAHTTGRMEDVDALYVSDGWRLDATKAFAVRVDFHFSKIGVGDGRVTLGLVPTIELPVMQWAQFEVGAFDAEPFYLYEVRDGAWVEEKVADRFADDGTLYVSYDPATDEVHLSDTGYGKANARWTVAGLVQGRWQSESVYITLGGGSEDGMALTAGDAWLDNFTIDAGTVVQ